MSTDGAAPRIWIDVEDLFHYAASSPRPSGIQRLSFEVQQALVARLGTAGPIHFVRHDPARPGFAEVGWHDVVTLFTGMVDAPAPPSRRAPGSRAKPGRLPQPTPGVARRMVRRVVRPVVRRLPLRVLDPLATSLRLQVRSWRALAQAVRAAPRRSRDAALGRLAVGSPAGFAAHVAKGDILLNLGSPWWSHDYVERVAQARRDHGVRFAQLFYDLIPLRHPEWCDRDLVMAFRTWLHDVLPLCDAVLAISQATARDVEAYASEVGRALPGPVRTIPIGTGFSAAAAATPTSASPGRDLPPAGTYALFVSTIEARKNHALLFRVWRRLLADRAATDVPTLVFAGRTGWLVADLLQQFENTAFLDGKLVVVEDPSDAELEALYRGCLFTLFPSFAEGWGLPVTESLAFGKPCIIANVSALPEAGGTLARYFDPHDVYDALRVIGAVIDDADGLAAWTARVREEFRPVAWDAAAEALLVAVAPALLEVGGGSPVGA